MADRIIPGQTVIGNKSCTRCGCKVYIYEEELYPPEYCMDCWEVVEEEKEAARAVREGLSIAFGPGPAVFDGAW